MANDQINQYPVTAVTIEDDSFFDIDQWTGAAFESQKVPVTLMTSMFGVNIGNSDLQIDDPVRKLLLQGASPDAVRFSIRDSADTIDHFRVAGGGGITFNEAYSFPIVDGGVGEVLTTNGSGSVSWAAGGGADTNIGTDDLTISASGVRKLTMGGALSTDLFQLQDTSGNILFSFGGDGHFQIGKDSVNTTGGAAITSTVIGNQATNQGYQNSCVMGYQAKSHGVGGTSFGYGAEANNRAASLGFQAGWSGLGYGATAIGHQTMTFYSYGMAIGHLARASDVNCGMISFSSSMRENTQTKSLAVNFDTTDHAWRIAETADQWNIGTGSFGYGTMTPDASAIVQMDSTTKGFLPPVMTTAEKNAISTPATGLTVFDSDLAKLCVYTGSAWETIEQLDTIQFAATDLTTDFTVATFDVVIPVPYGFYVTEVRANVKTAPTGSDAIFDIKMNGTTMLSTLLSIDATELTSTTATTPAAISVPTLVNDNIITINCTQIGSTIAGNGLTITLNGYRL